MILRSLFNGSGSGYIHDIGSAVNAAAQRHCVDRLSFRPLLLNPHIQTVLGSFGSTRDRLPHSTPHFVPLRDGDILYCEEARPRQWTAGAPTAVLMHGLGGSTSSRYIVRLMKELFDNAIRVVGVNMRACGKGLPLAKKTYHAGLSDDLFAVLSYFHELEPQSPTTVIGFSLGGNLALKMAGEDRPDLDRVVKKVVAVCPPFDLDQVVQKLSHMRNRLYLRYFINAMRAHFCEWARYHGKEIPPFNRRGSLYSFDDAHTARVWGFRDARDYYSQASCIKYLPRIKLQELVILASKDDPIVDNHSLAHVALPPGAKVWMTTHGGHMGFLGSPFRGEGVRWLDKHLVKQVYR